ncbi:hypothetical protein ACFY9S_39500 [Streptomyces sp. NPDC012474]|uniref:hypothetical protein n=1 Tax=Streptomyces sp. NPDC012474 TaxID=3364836 RepID=UPI0036E5C0BC
MYRLDVEDRIARPEVLGQFLAQLAQHDDRHVITFGADRCGRILDRRKLGAHP